LEYLARFFLEKDNLKEKKPDHLKLMINSLGGEVSVGFAIIDLMNSLSIPVYTYGIGQIYSCGLFVFMAGSPGHRFLFKNTSVMSHQWSGVVEGKEHEQQAASKENKRVSARIMKHYETCTGLSKQEILDTLLPAGDVYLTPNEAIKYNLADRIITKFN
jgi:ATP-dependent Clp endopeptidase proteolytic subunit ClpP